MTFDQEVILWCVVAPALIALSALLAAYFIAGKRDSANDHGALRLQSVSWVIAIGWSVAVMAAILGRGEWQWWPNDAWRRAIGPVLGWSIWSAFAVRYRGADATWMLAGLLATGTAMFAMPTGENWEDVYGLHRTWFALVATSCLINSWSIRQMAHAGAERWVLLVSLAGLGGPLALAASTYASLTECAIAAAVATIVFAVAGLSGKFSQAWVASFPIAAMAVSLGTAARFYSYEEFPAWSYGCMLFLPSVVALIDRVARRQRSPIRIAVAATVSAAMVAACVWVFLFQEAEQW